jgi:RNA ligase (TIGR02306 family)
MEQSESNSDSKRKLASVQVVDALIKHPNADTLELATILGWQVSVKIGEVKLGQLVVYCEVDSLLPAHADWLPQAVKDRIKTQSKDLKFFRVKTIKQRGELSQGLIVSSLPMVADLPVGTDLTEKLGVEK